MTYLIFQIPHPGNEIPKVRVGQSDIKFPVKILTNFKGCFADLAFNLTLANYTP